MRYRKKRELEMAICYQLQDFNIWQQICLGPITMSLGDYLIINKILNREENLRQNEKWMKKEKEVWYY